MYDYKQYAISCTGFTDFFVCNGDVICVISGFRRDVDEICALLRCYAVLNGSSVPTFQDNLSVPSSRVMGQMGCPETLVKNGH